MYQARAEHPDLTAEGFQPPRWMVVTAGGVILAAGVASAAFNMNLKEARAPVADGPPPAASTTAVANAAQQAVPLGAIVVADRGSEPAPVIAVKTPPKTEDESITALEHEPAPADEATETAPLAPSEAVGL